MKIKLLEILSNRNGDGNEQILQLYNCTIVKAELIKQTRQ